MVQYFSNSITNKQQASKIWSLYSFEGFLLYLRDIVKITKATNINKSIIEKYFLEKEMRGAAAPRTPRLKRKDTLHAYRVAANATDYARFGKT